MCIYLLVMFTAIGCLMVRVLAVGPMGLPAVGSGPAKDGGLLWVIKIHSMNSSEGK